MDSGTWTPGTECVWGNLDYAVKAQGEGVSAFINEGTVNLLSLPKNTWRGHELKIWETQKD